MDLDLDAVGLELEFSFILMDFFGGGLAGRIVSWRSALDRFFDSNVTELLDRPVAVGVLMGLGNSALGFVADLSCRDITGNVILMVLTRRPNRLTT